VLSDGTQARSWEDEGWGDQWIALVESLMRQVQPDNDNRTDCFYVLRTAAYVCLSLQWTKQAQHYAQAIRLLQDEQPDVAQRQRYLIEASLIDLKLAHQIADTQAINRIGTHLTHLLATWEADVQGLPLNSERVRQYRMLCHNVAAPLYRAQQYQLAIPLFRRAITYGAMPSEPFLWLAACIWATTPPTPKCRNDVGALLAQAARRYDNGSDPWQRFRALPEFENVDFEREFGKIIILHALHLYTDLYAFPLQKPLHLLVILLQEEFVLVRY
jgi:hypothetical protein